MIIILILTVLAAVAAYCYEGEAQYISACLGYILAALLLVSSAFSRLKIAGILVSVLCCAALVYITQTL